MTASISTRSLPIFAILVWCTASGARKRLRAAQKENGGQRKRNLKSASPGRKVEPAKFQKGSSGRSTLRGSCAREFDTGRQETLLVTARSSQQKGPSRVRASAQPADVDRPKSELDRVLDTIRQPLLVLDLNLRVVAAN